MSEIVNSATVLPSLEFEGVKMRRLEDGSVSVIDLIRFVGGVKSSNSAWVVWIRLQEKYPEVTTNCRYLKFPGAGQRETPVVDKVTALEILGVLPGEAGRKYRREAANLLLAWYETPVELAKQIIEQSNQSEATEIYQAASEKYLSKYHPLFDEVRDRTDGDKFTYMNLNALNTKTVLSQSPKMVVSERGGKDARDKLTPTEYSLFAGLQDLELSAIRKFDSHGPEVYQTCKRVANKYQELLNEFT